MGLFAPETRLYYREHYRDDERDAAAWLKMTASKSFSFVVTHWHLAASPRMSGVDVWCLELKSHSWAGSLTSCNNRFPFTVWENVTELEQKVFTEDHGRVNALWKLFLHHVHTLAQHLVEILHRFDTDWVLLVLFSNSWHQIVMNMHYRYYSLTFVIDCFDCKS